ncbi:MAG: NUDIX domain-containing protein [Candidatus Roizmanbacteria bacterium]|nr:NUDIX domain-containing protein [Candidatus Roizmanbacteria bacterium]
MKPGIDYIGISVGAMIFNDENELFLTKRGEHVTNERGCWEIPGGKVEFGETLQQAIKREIQEEYGVAIELIQQFPAANHLIPNEKQHWVPTTFLAQFKNSQKPKILEPDKCDGIGWFPLNKLPTPLSIITKIDIEYYQYVLKPIK